MAGQEVCNRSLDLLPELLNKREKLGAGAAGEWKRGTMCQCQSWGQIQAESRGVLWESFKVLLS